jgi:hypothetical protein
VQLDDADLKTIQQRAADALRRYLSRPTGNTDDLRTAALNLVQGRQHFFNREGEPDWRGVSHAYRQWSRETYDLAGVPKDRLSSLQASVRYHVGHVLREVVDAETLADLGLLDQSPRQRSAERHANTYDLAGLFGPGGRITDGEQVSAALRGMVTALRRIDLGTAAVTNPDRVEEYSDRAKELQAMVSELVAVCRAVSPVVLWSDGTQHFNFADIASSALPSGLASFLLAPTSALGSVIAQNPARRHEAALLAEEAEALQRRVERLHSEAVSERAE